MAFGHAVVALFLCDPLEDMSNSSNDSSSATSPFLPTQSLDFSFDAVFVYDRQSDRLVHFNDRFIKLTQLAPDQIRTGSDWKTAIPFGALKDLPQSNQPREIDWLHKSGQNRRLLVNVTQFDNLNCYFLSELTEMVELQKRYEKEVLLRDELVRRMHKEAKEKEEALHQLFNQKADLVLLNSALDRRVFEFSFLLELSEASQLIISTQELALMAIDKLMTTFWFEFGIFLSEESLSSVLTSKLVKQQSRERDHRHRLDTPIRFPRAQEHIAESFARRSTVVVTPETNNELIREYGRILNSPIHELVLVPLIHKQNEYGMFHLINSGSEPRLSDNDLEIIKSAANQIAVGIENLELYQHSITDELTSLSNTRYFHSRLQTEMQKAARQRLPLSLVMIDVDHFKSINDRYGHPAGDAVLQRIAIEVSNSCRKSDIAARYGGEEFALILPETEMSGAKVVAEKIRRRVENISVSLNVGEIKATCSLGISVYPRLASDISSLIETADQALYKAKSQGRNRVCEFSRTLSNSA